MPKVQLTAAGGWASITSSLRASSSSHVGSPSATPSALASPASDATQAATRAGSAAGRPGTNTLTPKEQTPTALTSAMSAASPSAVL